MKAKIGSTIIGHIKAKEKPFEIYDSELKGFTLRVQPSGIMTYLVRYRLQDGKQTRHILGQHPIIKPAKARDDALKILAAVKDGIDPNAKSDIQNHTFKSFLEKVYAPWAEANRKDGKATVKRIEACFPDFFKLNLKEITAWNVEKWRTKRLKGGKQPSTVNRDLTALKALLSKACEWKHLVDNPLSAVKPSKVDNAAKVRFLSVDEEKRLMNAIDDREEKARAERAKANAWRRDRGYPLFPNLKTVSFTDHLKPMVLVSLNTGVRWGELTGLTWGNVDVENALVTITGGTAKSGKTRHIPLNTTALEALKKWKKQSSDPIVFPGREGNTLDNVNKSWHAVLSAAGIKDFRWHDLRHHFASKLVMAGVDLNTVRELMGHADLKMTLRYAHLAPEHKASAVEKLV
jgi:integrase